MMPAAESPSCQIRRLRGVIRWNVRTATMPSTGRTLTCWLPLAPMLAVFLGRSWLRSVQPVLPADWPDGAAVFSIWHEDALIAGALFRRFRSMALVSLSKDGQILSEILGGGRLRCVRGSSTRGGVVASRRILRGLADGRPLVTALDGPRGPAMVAKPGAARLAAMAGVPLYRLGFECRGCLRMGDWSRLRVPPPFSRPRVFLEAA